MCLTIQKRYHHLNRKSAKAITTKRPIVVWKRLVKTGPLGGASPYHGFWYQFGALVIQEMKQRRYKYGDSFYDQVGQGLHAHVKEPANSIWSVFPALIPAGSKIFLGDDRDVVSNQLIVFDSMQTLLVHCGVGMLGNPFPRKLLSNKRRGKKAAR